MKLKNGEINIAEQEYDLSSGKLDMDQELLYLFEMRYKNELMTAAKILQQKGKTFNQKWNEDAQVNLVSSCVYFCQYWMLKNFYDIIKGKKEIFSRNKPNPGYLTSRPQSVQQLMHLMFRNQAVYIFEQNTVSFFKNMPDTETAEYFNSEKIEQIKIVFKKEMGILAMSLPDICDGFMFDDRELLSVIGKNNTEQEMYTEMLEVVRKNPLNQRMVAKGFNTYVKPIIQGKL